MKEMSNYAKIRSLHLFSRKKFRILIVIEAVLVMLGIWGLFGKDAIYEYGLDAASCNFGTYSQELGGIAVYGTEEERGNLVDFTGLVLPRGTYRVQLQYATDSDMENSCEVTDLRLSDQTLKTNGTLLFSGLDHTDFDMWLLRDSTDLTVHVYYSGSGMLAVRGLRILQTNDWNRIQLFVMLCLISIVNIVYCYVQYDREYRIPVKNKTVTFCLGLIILFASLPLTLNYMMGGGDLGYHLMRVEGIKDGILNGQFPIRISPEWQQGYGYASPVFYGETVLYLAALFRLIGFTVTTSYRLFMLAVTIATVLIAYFCFKKIFQEAYVGVFCSMLYTLSVYRTYKTYCTGSWGECLGVMILPLILYGFYRVFTQDIREKSYKRSWVPLTAGFSLLVQSHLLTGEMVGLFTIILCIVMWKRVFRFQTFLVLAKTVIYSVLISAWFLVPFADYMLTGDFTIHHVSGRTIQDRGLFPAQLLFTYFIQGNDSEPVYNSASIGPGTAPVLALAGLAYLFFTGKIKKFTREENGFAKILAGFSLAAMLMSLNLFPWDRIQSWGDGAATLISSIQFPNRFLTIANVCLTGAAGILAKYVLEYGTRTVARCYFCGMTFLLCISGVYLLENLMDTFEPVRVYNNEGMGTGYISGAEYLPYGVDASKFMYHDPVCSGELKAEDYEKLSLGARVRLTNPGEVWERVSFALLYYKGYRAFDENSGQELSCHAGENGEVTVEIPPGFDGALTVRFVSPWYWRAGEAVTVLSLGIMILQRFLRKGLWQGKSTSGNGKEILGGETLGEAG